MASLNFPTAPADQQTYSANGITYQYDAAKSRWDIVPPTVEFETSAQLDLRDTANRSRSNHTGTQTASTITDFDTEVSNNTDVVANTSARHDAVTVVDSSEIDFTLTGQQITASIVPGSIDETKLDASVNASLDLADSATQPGDLATVAITGAYADLTDVDTTGLAVGQAMVWNGTFWVPGSTGREVLTANRTYYVRTDGNDSNDGLDDTAEKAFLTIQKAIDVAAALDLSGFNVTVRVADGTYTTGITTKVIVGGNISIVGNTATPSNVILQSTAQVINQTQNNYSWSGFKLQTTAAGYTILFGVAGSINTSISNMVFGSVGGNGFPLLIALNGNLVATNLTFAGSAGAAMFADTGGSIRFQATTITLSGTPAFTYGFVLARGGGVVLGDGCTFVGTATGKRYDAYANGVVITFGGASYFPGSIAGTTATGGQYV